MTAELVLHLELDGFEVVNQKDSVKDSSGKNHVGELKGEVGIVADDAFGACAEFDGDTKSYIEVPPAPLLNITGDVTVEAWAYFTKAATSWVRVIGKGTSGSRNYGLWYIMSGTTVRCLFQRGSQPPFDDCTAAFETMPLNTWYHLAGVVEGTKSFLYVHDLKGKLIGERKLDNKSAGATLDNDSAVTIGHSVFPGHAAHSGKIAHARIYKGARSQVEIEHDISSDRLALVPFRKSHPIDFRLYDEDGQPVLCIVDDSADAKITAVKLELTNSSTQSIQIPPAPGTTGADDHHFALRFRPGTLSDSTKKKLKELTRANQATMLTETDEWELAHDGKDPGPVNLFLSYKGPKKSFNPQEQLTLTLHGISADAGSGARGTQVELIPHQLTYEGDDTPITGSRLRYIHITNHRGQKNIPLHVWFVNGNTVLNDGESTTDLTLRICNGSADRDIILNEKSSFVISFDVGEDWALTDKTNADKVKVTRGGSPLFSVGDFINLPAFVAKLRTQYPISKYLWNQFSASTQEVLTSATSTPEEQKLALVQALDNILKGVLIHETVRFAGVALSPETLALKSQNPKGTNLIRLNRLLLEDAYPLEIAKSPRGEIELPRPGRGQATNNTFREWELTFPKQQVLAKRGSKNSEAIEITLEEITTNLSSGHANLYVRYENIPGYQDGQFILTVEKTPLVYDAKGNIAIGKSIREKDPPKVDVNGTIDVNGTVIAERLSVSMANKPRGGLFFAVAGDFNHAVYNNLSNLDGEGAWDGAKWNTFGGLNIRVGNRSAKPSTQRSALLIDATGNVGIGTPNPGTKLEIMDGSLQVTASDYNRGGDQKIDAAYIGTFYDKDKHFGVGISSNGIAAIGHTGSMQNIFLKPKGSNGAVLVEGSLRVDGGPFMVKGDILHSGGRLDVQGPVRVSGSLEISESLRVKEKLQVDGSLIIHTEGITNETQAKQALNGSKHSIVFFVDSTGDPHLNWGFIDGKGKFYKGWASNT